MSISWFTKRPGLPPSQSEPDGSACTLLGASTPDIVRAPPEAGGGTHRVLAAVEGPCVCTPGDLHRVTHLRLGAGLYVAECPKSGFLWYRLPGEA